MKHLVIGLGEVGSAILNILQCDGFDNRSGGGGEPQYDTLHICFPWSEDFVFQVNRYADMWKPNQIVVHSSVPVGTCDKQGWTHSPVRGVHPNLEQGIRTFVKYFGGENAELVAKDFEAEGITCTIYEKASITEAIKLWDTTQYGIMIMLNKEIESFCRIHELPFEAVYTDANHTYDIGYEALNRPEVVRPYLKHMPGPIGGHCVIPNAHLLNDLSTRCVLPLVEYLIKTNEQLIDREDKQQR